MIKSLVATALLSFSVGGFPRENTQNVGVDTSLSLYGCYCIREDFTFPSADFEFDFDVGGYYYYYNSANDYGIDIMSNFYILCDGGVFDVEITNIDEEVYNFWFSDDLDFSHLMDKAQRTYIYITEPYSMTNTQADYFYKFFTSVGNSYCERYTGWFTFNNTTPQSTSDFIVFGNLSINNSLFSSLHCYNGSFGGVVANAQYYNGTVQQSYTFINSEGYIDDFKIKNAYFNDVFLAQTDKLNLARFGTFQYVPYVQQYTFGDMIFNIMDAPIYMLSKLMGVELFGIEIYLAFTSVITIMLICFVIKHVV